MGMIINNNIAALNAWRNLSTSNNNLSSSLEKLSSGYRINRGADDPAGLLISEKLRAQIGGLTQATSNASDAISMVQTAEGALTEMNTMLNSIRTLAVHAANTGSNDTASIQADQTAVDKAIESMQRIAVTTKFAGKTLLDGSATGSTLSSNNAGITVVTPGTINSGVASNYSASVYATGSIPLNITTPAAYPIVSGGAVFAGGNGSAGVDSSFYIFLTSGADQVASIPISVSGTVVSGNAVIGLGALSNSGTVQFAGNFTLKTLNNGAPAASLTITTVFGESLSGVIASINAHTASFGISAWNAGADDAGNSILALWRTNATGTSFGISVSGLYGTWTSDTLVSAYGANDLIKGATLNDTIDAINEHYASAGVWASATGAGDLTIARIGAYGTSLGIQVSGFAFGSAIAGGAASAHGVDVAGSLGSIPLIGSGLGMYGSTGMWSSMVIALSSGVATTAGPTTTGLVLDQNGQQIKFALTADAATNDLISYGINSMQANKIGIVSGLNSGGLNDIMSTGTFNLSANAADAVAIIDKAINDVSTERANLGSFQKFTLETTIDNLGITNENLTSSESRIRDVDMASEMMDFTKNQILVQAGTAMLAQANQLPQSVLKLLQG